MLDLTITPVIFDVPRAVIFFTAPQDLPSLPFSTVVSTVSPVMAPRTRCSGIKMSPWGLLTNAYPFGETEMVPV